MATTWLMLVLVNFSFAAINLGIALVKLLLNEDCRMPWWLNGMVSVLGLYSTLICYHFLDGELRLDRKKKRGGDEAQLES